MKGSKWSVKMKFTLKKILRDTLKCLTQINLQNKTIYSTRPFKSVCENSTLMKTKSQKRYKLQLNLFPLENIVKIVKLEIVIHSS